MDVFFNKAFYRELKKSYIPDERLDNAINEIINGNAVSLGHKLFKKRIGSLTKGKRGSYRAIAFYKIRDKIIFIYLFSKNEQDNISKNQMKGLIILSEYYNKLDVLKIKKLVRIRELIPYETRKSGQNS
jgi:hypothetical protein